MKPSSEKEQILTSRGLILILLTLIFSSVVSCSTPKVKGIDDIHYRIYGGPDGGTFKHISKGIANLANNIGIELRPVASKGSYENVRRVDSKTADFAIAYASHIYRARHGLLKNDSKQYKNIMVLGYFYGAPAQLIVKKQSGITSALELAGKKIAVGNKGSGSAFQCETFFRELGIWDKLKRRYFGYNDSAALFVENKIDAFWLFTGYPSGAVIKASQEQDIQLINAYDDGEKSNLFINHPYFTKTKIPANTYQGVNYDTNTFQDSALWIANRNVPEDVVYKLLEEVYSEKGMEYMVGVKKIAKWMTQNDGNFGISTPLHPGAIKYYEQ
jgi:TRAP transporter TAXI family solute receptor